MIELTRPAETARDFFASNPDSLEADEFAMGLLDSIEAYQPGEATGGVQGEAMVSEFLEQGVVSDPLEGYNNALADYRDYATQQGRQPFELADVVLRRKEAGENRFHLRELGAFLKNGTDSEPVFEHMAKRYGLDLEGYKEVRQMKGLKEKVFADILTQEITGMNDDIGRATLAKELGLDSWEPQAVLAAAPAYIEGKQKIVDTFADIPERAFSEALADESDVEMKWLDDINDPAIARQASALYANELKKFRARYREFLPLLKPFIDGADEVNPLDKIDDLTAIRYSELDADQRQRFQEAFHYLTNQSDTETASKLASPFKAAGRGIESIVKGGSLFLLRQERRDAEAIIKTGKVVEKVGAGPRKKDEGAFDWVTRDATEEEVLKAKRTVGILEMVEDLKSARDVVKPLDNSNLAMRGLNMIAGSVPHMLAFSNPVSGTIAGTSYMQDARTRLRNENPDLSPETLDNLSVAIGGAETAIQQVEFLTLGLGGTGKAIIPKGLLSKRFAEFIKTKGLKTIEVRAKAAGEFGKRATSTAALETIEEVSQEFAYDIGKEIGQNFDNQIPDARFGETMAQIAETAPELIITGLFFGAVGATGSVRSDLKLGKILKETKDSGERYVSGLSEVSWQRVDAAETDIEAAQVYRREWEEASPEERAENIAKVTPEQIAQEKNELEEQLGEEAALATNLEEVQEVTAELLGYHRDAGGRVSTEQRQEGDIPIRELENKDGSNRPGLVESARISLESSGVDTSTISDEQIWTQATANGMVIPGKRLGEFVIKFGENADSAVVTEEFAEFFKRDQVAKGVVTDIEVGENLLAYQRNVDSNAKFIPDNFEQMTEAQQAKASTEGFSSFVKAYAMAEARLPDSRLSETFTRSFVRMFEKALDYLRHLIGASTRMMDAIQSGQIKDHSELVTMAERALGLDIDYVAEYQRRELEGLEGEFKPLDIASKVRGKLPRPDDPIIAANPETGKEADPLVGELEGIWDALTQEAKDGKINRSKAVAFFAKKGEGAKLDELRRQVNENLREDEAAGALEFETPTQMLEAVLGSLEGEVSFSIGSTKVTPNEDTRSYPTADGRELIGPASFSIRAHHGTPHKVDKFSTDKMGTGEGAQAFGWGLYFAGNKNVASQYREKLSFKDFVNKFEFPEDIDFEGILEEAEAGAFPADVTLLLKALASDDWLGFDYPAQAISAALNAKTLQNFDASPELVEAAQLGNLYTVELKAKESELLDWDKQLHEQSQAVQKALSDHYELKGDPPIDPKNGPLDGRTEQPGESFYRSLPGTIEEKSEALKFLGIKGIKYLDGNSRNGGEGSYNYVIFDDADIEILMENGDPAFEAPALPSAPSFAVTLETQTALQKRIIEQFDGVGVESDKVAKLMARKVAAIEESYRKAVASDTYDKATAVSMALGRLSAIRDSLPIAIRHKIGGDRKISELKTEAARERELMERLHKAGLELEKYLVKEYREKIDKTLKKSQPKDSDNRTVKGKIGALGHEVAQAVTKYKTFDVDQAEVEAAKLEEELAEIEKPSLEQFERINALQQSAHLFHDFEHADSARLEQALEFVRTNYAVGRNEWIEVLQERKVKREQAVSDALAAMEAPAGITRAMLNKAEREAKEQKGLASMDEAFLQSLGSNHHAFARIVESAKDKEAGRKWYNALLDSRIKADMRGEEETEIAQEGFMGHLRDILNVKSGHAVRKWIYDSKQTVQEPGVTSVEGRVKQFVTVDIKLVDAMIRGEVAAKGKSKGEEVALDERDMAYLRDALDEFEALPDKVQRTRRVIRFERVVARGKRSSIGPLSQSNALMQWLTMRQADQRAKLEEIGFDSRTYAELEKFLKPETKAMGLWMVDYLKEMGVDLNRIHSLEYGVGMISHVNYFPVRNQVAGEITELSMDNPAQGRTMAPGALKSRVANRAEMDLNADAFAVFFAHVAEMGYWRQNVSWVREWGGVFKSPDFANAMKVKVGAKAYRNLTTYMGTIQNRGRQMGGAMMDGERFIKKLMSNSALAILGSRMSTIWINASAVFNSIASPDVSTKELLQNSLELIFDGKGDIKATWQNELQQMRRRQGASFEAQLAGKSSNAGHWLTQDSNALAQKGLAPMNEVDVAMNTLAIAALHRAARKKAELSGLESEAALIEADSAVTRAVATLAQPTLTVSRSAAEIKFMDNPFGALMMMFKSEVRKNTANNYVALRTLTTGKGLTDKKRAARIGFFYTVLYPALVAGMRELYKQLTDDEDKEDTLERMKDWKFWTYLMASDNFAGVPFFGDAASSLLAHQMDQQYWENRNLLARQAQDSMKALGVILDDKNQSPSEMADALIDSSQGAGSLFPGLATLAQAANVAEFGKKVVENGIGWELSEEDRLMRLEKGIQDNKSDIYEKFQVGEERHHAFAEYLKEFVQPADLEIILERDANRKTEGGEPASRRIPQAVRSQLEER